MKKTIIVLFAAIILPLAVQAQSKQINEILDRYENKKFVESIEINPSLLGFLASDEDKETKDLMNKLKRIRILTIPSTAQDNGLLLRYKIRAELFQLIKSENFARAVKVNDGDDLLEVYVAQNGEGALLFLASSTTQFTVISIFGKIDKSVINSVMNGSLKVK